MNIKETTEKLFENIIISIIVIMFFTGSILMFVSLFYQSWFMLLAGIIMFTISTILVILANQK